MGDEKDKHDSGVDFSKSGESHFVMRSRRIMSNTFLLTSSFFAVSPIARLDHLEQLITNTNANKLKDLQVWPMNETSKILSVESLLDCLIVLFDECQNSSLRREKTVSEFLELRK